MFTPSNYEEFNIKKGTKVAVIVSQYHSNITYPMRDQCVSTLKKHGIDEKNIRVVECYGAFEIPYLAQKIAEKKQVDAIITLGCIIRGETPHFDFVALGTTQGIINVSIKHSIPVIFGVLTTENINQAKVRIIKGEETALATLKLLTINI